jgi:hypothetical protein
LPDLLVEAVEVFAAPLDSLLDAIDLAGVFFFATVSVVDALVRLDLAACDLVDFLSSDALVVEPVFSDAEARFLGVVDVLAVELALVFDGTFVDVCFAAAFCGVGFDVVRVLAAVDCAAAGVVFFFLGAGLTGSLATTGGRTASQTGHKPEAWSFSPPHTLH